ncbi:MAG TPA: hypothetical protein VK088_10740 [Acidimicrobiia bacterium]|nr:hypothetical protein [Acidimicrobiia bacterium]
MSVTDTSIDDAPQEGQDTPDPEFDSDQALAKIKKLNSENRSLRARLKEAQEALEAAKNQEPETPATDPETEAKLRAAELRALRAEVALEKQLPPVLAKSLAGDDREALESHADELLELVSTVRDAPPATKPVSDLKPATKPADSGDAEDPLMASVKDLIGLRSD